ncbi:MAG: hypothetical protein IPJ62_15840 [Betaproteobacteria bacterium]|nr:hypothetical protein [Betaproteobacteria bacterium]
MLRLARIAGITLIATFAAFALALLTVRFVVFPQVESYRDDLTAALSRELGQPVEIDALETGWEGWNPKLGLTGFRVRDRARAIAAPLLDLPRVDMVVAWTSLPFLELRLKRLVIERPRLSIRRDRAGMLHVAGIEIDPAEAAGDTRLTDWILDQREILVRDALVAWDDDLRNAPQLLLDHVQLRLEHRFGEHRFGLHGTPPAELAAPIDIRGEWRGGSVSDWRSATGRMYVHLEYADVAAWREWLALPVQVDRGKGALQLWFGFGAGVAQDIVGDVELEDAVVRFEDRLPELRLDHVAGRFGWREQEGQQQVFGHDVRFALAGGGKIDPRRSRCRGAKPRPRCRRCCASSSTGCSSSRCARSRRTCRCRTRSAPTSPAMRRAARWRAGGCSGTGRAMHQRPMPAVPISATSASWRWACCRGEAGFPAASISARPGAR